MRLKPVTQVGLMTEAEWVDCRTAGQILGVGAQSVSHLALYKNLERRKDGRKFFYRLADLRAVRIESEQNTPKHALRADFPEFNEFWRLEGDWLVISDTHCPYVDWGLWEKLLLRRDELGIRKLLIGGDLLNCSAFSPFKSLFGKISWETEKAVAQEFLQACIENFDEVRVLTANHELWFLKKLEGQAEWSDLWDIITGPFDDAERKKMHFSAYPYCDINGLWRCVHPGTYRKIPLSLSRELSWIEGRNIIMFHGHMMAWGYAPNGKTEICDCGLFANPEQFQYKSMRVTAHGKWNRGFVAIKDNRLMLYPQGERK
jgi:hypothetical protein